MTDVAPRSLLLDAEEPAGRSVHTTAASRQRLKRRYGREWLFKAFGLGAIMLSGLFLVTLLWTVVRDAIPAFTYNYVTLPADLSAVPAGDPATGDYRAAIQTGVAAALPFATARNDARAARGLVSTGADVLLRNDVVDEPGLAGAVRDVAIPVSDTADLYLKGIGIAKERVPLAGSIVPSGVEGEITLAGDLRPVIKEKIAPTDPSLLLAINNGVVRLTGLDAAGAATGQVLVPLSSRAPAAGEAVRLDRITPPEGNRKFSDREIAYTDALVAAGRIDSRFNTLLFTGGASREPELAGVKGAVVGSLLTMLVTLFLSFPIGVAAALYLEEFAPKNRFTDLIEVNINNLAAVPSIVFGLLGLAVFLNFFGLPRSAPLVGGLVLALMSLPIIIIASRAALRAVPPSIREAALGVGASKLQAVFHHVLPLAMPGIMTGTILGMAHALGETAPLLMIGMVAFIVDTPTSVLEPATLLPVQIYMWADFPEIGFQQKTSAAILVLLAFLFLMNFVAIVLRKRFERRW